MRDIIGDFLQRPWRSVTCLLRERLGTNQRLGLCSFRGYGGHLFPCSPSSLLGAGRHEWYRRIETPVAGNWGRDAELTGFGGDLFVSKRSILASLAQQRGPSPPFTVNRVARLPSKRLRSFSRPTAIGRGRDRCKAERQIARARWQHAGDQGEEHLCGVGTEPTCGSDCGHAVGLGWRASGRWSEQQKTASNGESGARP